MAQVFHRYLGKDGKIPKPPKPTPKQEERDALNAKLITARVRERESIAKIREMELARKRGALIPLQIHQRIVSWAFRVFNEHCRGGPTLLVRLVERTLRGKVALDDVDKHALRMAFTDVVVQQWLTELGDNLKKPPAEFIKDEWV